MQINLSEQDLQKISDLAVDLIKQYSNKDVDVRLHRVVCLLKAFEAVCLANGQVVSIQTPVERQWITGALD